ncbi:MAG TPA: septal ring lytic transglycosylase RlpA family protein [Pseudolabrys sp.]|nr:septal ring lytic transglycosylase RlpA family protein [Pseudolabrys sp.]
MPARYGSISNSIDVPMPPIKPEPVPVDVVAALQTQAACLTGGLFDACPGFLDLLQAQHQAWPQFGDVALPLEDTSMTIAALPQVASSAGTVNLASITPERAPVDSIAFRTGEAIMGAASMYNPYDAKDVDSGSLETASGELYSPIAWTAAIQIDLRDKFAGVHYGRLYDARFALVELNGRRAIVKINDVGPLRPGRVIDLSEQVMHYFDPSLRRGVLDGALVTPLVGNNWTPGPLGHSPAPAVPVRPMTVASNQGSID